MSEGRQTDLFPPCARDDGPTARLRASINTAANKIIGDTDAAVRLRTAPPEVQKTRHLVVGKLREAGLLALHALDRATPDDEPAFLRDR